MGEKFNSLVPEVQAHIKSLVRTAKLEDNDESLEMLSDGWLEKQQSFFEQTKQREMEEVDNFNIDDLRGALVMTYSGSLINIGPEQNDLRSVLYYSIGLRNDVPESAEEDSSVLGSSIEKGKTVIFEKGPIAKSSPVLSIAVFKEEMALEPEKEEELLEEVTMIIAQDFASINKTTILED
ncbi:MAG: hypothetical protein JEY99_13805 [Spirochaetales bacterium]|nr:hypothetical protein [Spirochaetales bacterium]